MIKVLALIGSPRKGGNSDILADEVLKGAQNSGAETEKVYLDDFFIRPIGEVGDNSRDRDDPRADDDFLKLLEPFLDTDIIVWSTPIYWYGVSAQMKCFIDRLSSYFNRPPFAQRFDGKGHVVLCTFGSPDDKHGTFITEPMKMTIGVLRGIYLGDLCVSSCYEKGKIKEKKNVLLNAYELGKNVINKYTESRNKKPTISQNH
jgi:multimeric flavodoxin WrbA